MKDYSKQDFLKTKDDLLEQTVNIIKLVDKDQAIKILKMYRETYHTQKLVEELIKKEV